MEQGACHFFGGAGGAFGAAGVFGVADAAGGVDAAGAAEPAGVSAGRPLPSSRFE